MTAAAAQSAHFLCKLDDLPDPGSRGFVVGAGPARAALFVVRHGAALRAYVNRCPHTGVMLDWVPDQFLTADATQIQCATHGALFNIDDGLCTAGPCAGDRLTAVTIELREGGLYVDPATVEHRPPAGMTSAGPGDPGEEKE